MAGLTTVEAVRNRGGLEDLEDVNIKVSEAISLTSARLEEALRTPFDRVATFDEFYINRRKLTTQPKRIKLLTNVGFIDSGVTPTVKLASDIEDLSAGTALEASNLRWDYEKGVVIIIGSDQLETALNRFDTFGALYARVDYTAGFTTEDEIADGVDSKLVYVQTEVPSWLIEAATQWSLVTYDWLVSDKRDARTFQGATDFKDRLEMSIIASHMRYVPTAVRALY